MCCSFTNIILWRSNYCNYWFRLNCYNYLIGFFTTRCCNRFFNRIRCCNNWIYCRIWISWCKTYWVTTPRISRTYCWISTNSYRIPYTNWCIWNYYWIWKWIDNNLKLILHRTSRDIVSYSIGVILGNHLIKKYVNLMLLRQNIP